MEVFEVASSLAVGQSATVIKSGKELKLTRTPEGCDVEADGVAITGIPCNREQARLG